MIIAITSMKMKPGMRDKFIQAALKCAEATHKEKGCIQYEYTLKPDDPDGVLAIEQWENMECAFAHMETEHFKALTGYTHEIVAGFDVKLFDATPSNALAHIFPSSRI